MTWFKKLKISQKTVSLYHGTHTGKNDANIASFRQGIDLAKGKDYRQGIGLYGYPSFAAASSVATQRAQDNETKPMVVQIDVPVTDITLDYEHQYPTLMQILANNFDKFKMIPVIATPEGTIDTQKSRLNTSSNTISFQFTNGRRRSFGYGKSFDAGGIEAGSIVYAIIQAIERISPNIKKQLSNAVSESIKNNEAIKYTGDAVRPSAIYVSSDGNWSKISL